MGIWVAISSIWDKIAADIERKPQGDEILICSSKGPINIYVGGGNLWNVKLFFKGEMQLFSWYWRREHKNNIQQMVDLKGELKFFYKNIKNPPFPNPQKILIDP